MRGKAADDGMRKGSDSRKKLLSILFLFILLFTISAPIVEAAAMTKVSAAWASMKVFVLNPAFWVNAIIIFGAIFLLYSLLLSNKVGNDTSGKVVMIIVLIIIAMVISTHIKTDQGVPDYIWKNTQFSKFTRFLIGSGQTTRTCAGGVGSQIKSILDWSTPSCCGTGAYETVIRGRTVCRQAILRTNENGSGLPAFIIALILFYILFNAYGSKLGLGSTGSGGGKWFPILLTVLLAALVTNQRLTKNGLVIIGGWIALIIIGVNMSKSFAGDQKGQHYKRAFAFGLAFAFVELIANILGTSLYGYSVPASDITIISIIWNIIKGMPLGLIYSWLVGDRIYGRIKDRVDERQQKDIQQLIDEGYYGKPFMRNTPMVGGIP
jgi:hypothetical protein